VRDHGRVPPVCRQLLLDESRHASTRVPVTRRRIYRTHVASPVLPMGVQIQPVGHSPSP
jgi:hypothetical protein